MNAKRRGRPAKAKPPQLADDELPAMPQLKRSRIQYVKEYPATSRVTGNLERRINDELGNRALGDPKVMAIHPIHHVNGHAVSRDEARVLVVFERDERRTDPGRKGEVKDGPTRRTGDKADDNGGTPLDDNDIIETVKATKVTRLRRHKE